MWLVLCWKDVVSPRFLQVIMSSFSFSFVHSNNRILFYFFLFFIFWETGWRVTSSLYTTPNFSSCLNVKNLFIRSRNLTEICIWFQLQGYVNISLSCEDNKKVQIQRALVLCWLCVSLEKPCWCDSKKWVNYLMSVNLESMLKIVSHVTKKAGFVAMQSTFAM